MLLTRLPLGGKSKSIFVQARRFQWATSFDLHVLGMPPAFILSQDQTLIKKIYFKFFLATQILTFYLVFKDRFTSPILTSALVIYQVLFPLSTFFVSFLTFSLFFT